MCLCSQTIFLSLFLFSWLFRFIKIVFLLFATGKKIKPFTKSMSLKIKGLIRKNFSCQNLSVNKQGSLSIYKRVCSCWLECLVECLCRSFPRSYVHTKRKEWKMHNEMQLLLNEHSYFLIFDFSYFSHQLNQNLTWHLHRVTIQG